jgi:hypothetical protein
MDFGLIALILVLAKTALDYIAPRTKTKADDKARDAVGRAQEFLPAAKALAGVAAKPATPTKEVTGFGMGRDHRSK